MFTFSSQLSNFMKSVVTIDCSVYRFVNSGSSGSFYGTGFVIDKKQGLIATCKHVTPKTTSSAHITFEKGQRIKAEVLYCDPWYDFAILKFDPTKAPVDIEEVEMSDFRDYEVGTEVMMIGTNEGEPKSIKTGVIVNKEELIGRHCLHMRTSFDRAGGSSGAPVFCIDGKVIGIHTRGSDTTSWELNSLYIKNALEFIRQNKNVKRRDVGIRMDNIASSVAVENLQIDLDELRVNGIRTTDSLLFIKKYYNYAGSEDLLFPGDIILAIDDVVVKDDVLLLDKLINDAESKCRILIMRWGKLLTIEVPTFDAELSIPESYIVFAGATIHELTPFIRGFHRIGEAEGVLLCQAQWSSPMTNIGQGSRTTDESRVVVIRAINGIKTPDLKAFIKAIKDLKHDQDIALDNEDVWHGWTPALDWIKLDLVHYPTQYFGIKADGDIEIGEVA